MPLYYLDPRQADTGAPYDLDMIETQWGWRAADLRDRSASAASRLIPGTLKTEAEALRHAREAAGFGHVAERACFAFVRPCRADAHYHGEACDTECDVCTWPRAAHGA